MTTTPGRFAVVRARLRRVQFVVGLGFLAFVLGGFLSSSIALQLPALHEAERPVAVALFGVALARVWLLLVLPLLAYGAARIVDLKPMGSAVGAALCGESFQAAILAVTLGWEGIFRGWAEAVFRLVTLALGVWVTRWAIQRGRAAAARTDEKTQEKAKSRQAEYAEFLATAERIAGGPLEPPTAGPPEEVAPSSKPEPGP